MGLADAASAPRVTAPDGSTVRVLTATVGGSAITAELGAGQVSVAVRHRTVDEIWFVLSGTGRIWRSRGGSDASEDELAEGVSLTIQAGTAFQFRAGSDGPLTVFIVTMPPWPGEGEAELAAELWQPTVVAGPL